MIEDIYAAEVATSGDINEHLDTLRSLAAECVHVTELGMRNGSSTAALLAGVRDILVSVDLHPSPPDVLRLQAAASIGGRLFKFVHADSLQVDIWPTDFLFIDTIHTRGQLSAELKRHAHRVGSIIAMHDTETFGFVGEGGGEGLRPAIDEFVEASDWYVADHYTHNNGLTVLRRQ